MILAIRYYAQRRTSTATQFWADYKLCSPAAKPIISPGGQISQISRLF